jgi:hypothetical protein
MLNRFLGAPELRRNLFNRMHPLTRLGQLNRIGFHLQIRTLITKRLSPSHLSFPFMSPPAPRPISNIANATGGLKTK